MDSTKKSSFLIRDILTAINEKSETNETKSDEDLDSEHKLQSKEEKNQHASFEEEYHSDGKEYSNGKIID